MSTETNSVTADIATERHAINLRKCSLIGIVGTAQSPRALVRSAGGKITTLAVGDTISNSTITAISEYTVMIRTPTGPRTLSLPQRVAPAAA